MLYHEVSKDTKGHEEEQRRCQSPGAFFVPLRVLRVFVVAFQVVAEED